MTRNYSLGVPQQSIPGMQFVITIVITTEASTIQYHKPQLYFASSDRLKPTAITSSKGTQGCFTISWLRSLIDEIICGQEKNHLHYCHHDTTANCAFKLLDSNSKFINGTKITNNHHDNWWFMRTLPDGSTIAQHDAMLGGIYSFICFAVMHDQKKN